MKKLLAILGAIGLTTTGASSVVACDNHNNKTEKKNDNIKPGPKPLHINKTYEEELKTDVWDFENITIDALSNINKYQFTHKSDVTGIIWNISIS